MLAKIFAAVLTVIVSVILALLSLELGVRAATGTLGEFRNYATDPINLVRGGVAIDFDPEIGWVLQKDRPDIGHGQWRNRLHTPSAPPIDNPILAIGDSFTYGSDVEADESWPAQLEKLIGIPVVNGGVGGYGIDQAVLWAERLAPQIKPRLILFSYIASDVLRTQLSIFSGAAKPYFDIVDGELVPQNLPLMPYSPSVRYIGVRAIIGYSKLMDWVADRLGMTGRWRASSMESRGQHVDALKVSCAFVKRLSRIGFPVVIVAQHGWYNFNEVGREELKITNALIKCGRDNHIKVIDTFDDMRALLPSTYGPEYQKVFVNGKGHMTAFGNALVAAAIAKFLSDRRGGGFMTSN